MEDCTDAIRFPFWQGLIKLIFVPSQDGIVVHNDPRRTIGTTPTSFVWARNDAMDANERKKGERQFGCFCHYSKDENFQWHSHPSPSKGHHSSWFLPFWDRIVRGCLSQLSIWNAKAKRFQSLFILHRPPNLSIRLPWKQVRIWQYNASRVGERNQNESQCPGWVNEELKRFFGRGRYRFSHHLGKYPPNPKKTETETMRVVKCPSLAIL